MLEHPAFREDKIALAQYQLNTEIARRNDDMSQIARRVSTQLAYGPKSPYARFPEYATVAAVTREDLVEWHHKYVHPNNIIFGVVGDFDSKAMEARIRQAFGSWPKGPETPRTEIAFHPEKPQVYFVPKEDVNQSDIQMVSLGIERNNPDYFAVEVMNYAFGAGFSSRLLKELRTAKGLAYAVGGGIGSAFDHRGIFRLAMGTKSATTAEALAGLKQELQKLIDDPPKGEELRTAKDTILNAFIFNFDSKEKVLREQMAYEYYGYPLDFLERYHAGIEKTTAEDIARVAKKYIHPEQFATLVVGNPEEIGNQLTSQGPVAKWDITIPPPPGEKRGNRPPVRRASSSNGPVLGAQTEGAPPFPAVGKGGDFDFVYIADRYIPFCEPARTKVKDPTLTSNSTTLGWGTLGIHSGMKDSALFGVVGWATRPVEATRRAATRGGYAPWFRRQFNMWRDTIALSGDPIALPAVGVRDFPSWCVLSVTYGTERQAFWGRDSGLRQLHLTSKTASERR